MPRRHGSLQFRPRKRAKTQKAVFRSYPELPVAEPRLVAFPGYKAGMTHVIVVEDRPGRPTTGQEVAVPVTVVETPPVRVIGLVPYVRTPYGLKSLTAILKYDGAGDLRRTATFPEAADTVDEGMKKVEDHMDRLAEVRILVHTIPRNAGIHKKKPEVLEIPLSGGSVEARLEKALSMLGEIARVSDVFVEGQLVDVTAVTRGLGWQGVVRRFGVELLPHKAGKGRRRVGSLGSRHPPFVTWRVPRAGQTGYHKRTEYNKRILAIRLADVDGDGRILRPSENINPPWGFKRYGMVLSDYVILAGSTPGPPKRFLMLRHPTRPYSEALTIANPELRAPEIRYVHGVVGIRAG
mgnify:CR=1 FL=1